MIYSIALLITGFLWFLSLYNIVVLVAGVRSLRGGRIKGKLASVDRSILPKVSLIVPVKDEAKVVGRLFKALVKADYAEDKKEIVIVEDGSVDRTGEICSKFARLYPDQVSRFRGK